jgi:hypothetical protein
MLNLYITAIESKAMNHVVDLTCQFDDMASKFIARDNQQLVLVGVVHKEWQG